MVMNALLHALASVPVPNVAGALLWPYDCVVNWRLETFPCLFADQPPRFLPALWTVGPIEERTRTEFWLSVVLLSPVLMAMLCEIFRMLTLIFKKKPGDASAFNLVATLELAEGQEVTARHPFAGPKGCFTAGLVLYHMICAGITCIAATCNWYSPKGVGNIAWELWALWQQLCLWSLFFQNVVRCCWMDANALQMSTFKSVLLYTVPMASELFDTMKDWVITGFCFLQHSSIAGYVCGTLVIVIEVLGLACNCLPHHVRITDSIRMSPPASYLMLFYGTIIVVYMGGSLALWVFYIIFYVFAGLWIVVSSFPLTTFLVLLFIVIYLCADREQPMLLQDLVACLCPLLSGCCALVILVVLVLAPILPGLANDMKADLHGMWRQLCLLETPEKFTAQVRGFIIDALQFLTNAGLLGLLSVYVVVSSYIQVNLHEDCAQDLRKSYFPILLLPLKKAPSVSETITERLTREASNFFVDFISSSRLMIAWAEDCPQAFIGVALSIRYTMPDKGIKGLGFAGFSAAVSTAKAILIPLGQQAVLEQRRRDVRQELEALVTSESLDQFARDSLTSTVVQRSEITKILQGHLLNSSEDVLTRWNVGLRELFQPIIAERDKWVKDNTREKEHELVTCLLPFYKKAGFSADDMQKAGYADHDLREAGFF
ncbi:unnamed protein product [Symbiodinium sp. CCMP2456]|nr:unnamed protein product [Symbiodinium sp. CCMP2456]